LFPDEFVTESALSAEDWFEGSLKVRERVSMDPEKRKSIKREPVKMESTKTESRSTTTAEVKPSQASKQDIPTFELKPSQPTPTGEVKAEVKPSHPLPSKEPPPAKEIPPQKQGPSTLPPVKPQPGTYTRKFLTGRLHHPSTHFTSLPQPPTTTSLHRTLQTTSKHISFPISGPGGRIALLSVNNPGRHASPTTFSHGRTVIDFAMRGGEVVTAGEDGRVKVWTIQGDNVVEEERKLEGMEKVIQVEWHPYIEALIGVLCVDSGKHEIRLWDYTAEGYKRIPLSCSVLSRCRELTIGIFNCVE
jgi:coronin-7